VSVSSNSAQEARPVPTGEGRARAGIRHVWRHRTLAQVVVFTGSSAAASLLSGAAQALLARRLTVDAFGTYSLAYSCLQVGALFFEFGLFLPAARLLAEADARRQRELVGAAVALYVCIGVLFVAAIVGFSRIADTIFTVNVGTALAVTAPLAIAYPFGVVALQLTQGAGRLHIYSAGNLVGQAFFVAVLAALLQLGLGETAAAGLAVRGLTLGVGWMIVVVWLRPVLRRPLDDIRSFSQQARAYGFQVYVGRVLSVGTYNLDVLMLGALTNARAVALYALAGAIATVIGLPTSGLAGAVFPRMVEEGEMRRAWLAWAWGVGLAGTLVAWALGGLFISLVFTDAYSHAAAYIVPLALAQTVRGVTTIYNGFLSAQAAGRELRNAGLVLTVSNVVLNGVLIPQYGAGGAAWASLAALAANLGAHMVGYRRVRRRLAGAVGTRDAAERGAGGKTALGDGEAGRDPVMVPRFPREDQGTPPEGATGDGAPTGPR
jgi:O-antigen/teichoic acid export membrane protein